MNPGCAPQSLAAKLRLAWSLPARYRTGNREQATDEQGLLLQFQLSPAPVMPPESVPAEPVSPADAPWERPRSPDHAAVDSSKAVDPL
jgi:hypothetical protein